MTGIAGKTNFLIRQDCEGWISSEDYLLEFAYDTGDSALLASHFESWEEGGGTLYSFEVDERSTYEEEKQFNGFATLPPAGDAPVAYFSMQPDVALSLPDQIYFPIAHTRALLERAEKGEKLFSANIFFGAEPDRAIKRTSTVIGTRQKVTDKEVLGALADSSYYPIKSPILTRAVLIQCQNMKSPFICNQMGLSLIMRLIMAISLLMPN